MPVDPHVDDDQVDIRVVGEVLRISVGSGGGGEIVAFRSGLGRLDGGVA